MNDEMIERERKRLPLLWRSVGGGRSLKALPALLEAGEEMLALCPGNFKAGDASSATNYLLVATDRRLIVVRLGAFGAAKDHTSIPYPQLGSFDADREKGRLELRGAGVELSLAKLPHEQLADLERVVVEHRS
jgi:hypothetical protein